MPNATSLRLAWEPRVLSILRLVVGVLYMQHGLNKLFDFPPTPTHMPYRLFSLVPGLAGPLEVVRRVVDRARPVYAASGLHSVRRNGFRLFHGACTKKLFSILEQWR